MKIDSSVVRSNKATKKVAAAKQRMSVKRLLSIVFIAEKNKALLDVDLGGRRFVLQPSRRLVG